LDVMKDPDCMHEIDPAKGAFSKAYGVDMGVLPWLGTPDGAELLRKFGTGVPWLSGITVVATRTDIPWDSYGKTVCDVGCGPGSVMLEVKKKYPNLNIICQDLEPMIPVVKEVRSVHTFLTKTFKALPEALADGSVKPMVHDYFTPQETQADVYWMRGVVYVLFELSNVVGTIKMKKHKKFWRICVMHWRRIPRPGSLSTN
jgi:hypothetical protein